jgi:hypothetical protein
LQGAGHKTLQIPWFLVPGAKNTVNTVVLGLRGVKKHGFYGVFCSETLQKTRKHQRIDDFWALKMIVFCFQNACTVSV